MFGFSIQKFLVLASIIGAVWYGFKLVGRLDRNRRAGAPGERGFADGMRRWASRMQRGGRPGGSGETEDMVKCSVCGAYVAANSVSSCGRGDCPY